MSASSLVTTVELTLSASGLEDRDATSKSDPLCVIYLKDADGWTRIGQTERLNNCLDPTWATPITLDYFFEQRQEIKFKIFDDDSSAFDNEDDALGSLTTTLGEIVSSPTKPFTRSLNKHRGSLSVLATQVSASDETVFLQCRASNLDNKDFFGKSDPFFVISRKMDNGVFTVVHRSEVVEDDLNPQWAPFDILASRLCGGNKSDPVISVQVFDHDADGGHDLIGGFVASFDDFLSSRDNNSPFPLVSEKKRAKKKSYENSGLFSLNSFRVEKNHSFLEFIQNGTRLNFTVAVDFTASNGDPRDPDSLHYANPAAPNQYIQAIRAVGEIIQDYDDDQFFPTLGFGGKLPDGRVSHEFFLNGHPTNPQCHRVDGILAAYANALSNVQLWGPTNFSPVINHVVRIVQSFPFDGRQYSVLLIVTDGAISDPDETIDAIIRASQLPLSIVIVGVGDADFSAMSVLDADGKRLSRNGCVAARDIVQFVQFSDHCVSEKMGVSETLFVRNQAKLAKAVLAEIPKQLTAFMMHNGFKPGGA